MSVQIVFLLTMILLSAIFLSLSICFFVRTKNKQANCTQRTAGTVIKYSQMDDSVCLPVVEYFVDGKRYTGKRKWRFYKTVQAPSIKQSSTEINAEKNTITIKENSFIFIDPMRELYPIGMQLDVFYNAKKPKQSYVEIIDKKPSVIGKIMFFVGIGSATVGITIYLLLMYI